MKISKYKLKVICGFRKEQEYTIDANEAHKAYYLFANPDKRMIFSDGLALKGTDIQRIVPDYNAIMGWNPTHQLTNDDWNELNANGVSQKMQGIMVGAKEVARIADPKDLATPLSELKDKFPLLGRHGSLYAQQVLGA